MRGYDSNSALDLTAGGPLLRTFRRLPQRSREAAAAGQDDRSPVELATYERGLEGVGSWYGHPMTNVLLVDSGLPEGEHTYRQPYLERGWCLMQYFASGIVKNRCCLLSLSKLSGNETSFSEMWQKGNAERAPPMAPDIFTEAIESGSNTGAVHLANRDDVPVVVGIYDQAFTAAMDKALKLSYGFLGWDDGQGCTLCEALSYAHGHGGLQKLKELDLFNNQLGDEFVVALVKLLNEDGLANLERLDLSSNAITDVGMRELAKAIAHRKLPKCWWIGIGSNPGDEDVVKEALDNRGSHALQSGDLEDARLVYEEALEASRATLGDTHPDTLQMMGKMGLLLMQMGRQAEARPLCTEAMEGSRATLGNQDPRTLTAINTMGKLLYTLGELEEAAAMMEEVVRGYKETLGNDHPDTRNATIGLNMLLRRLIRGRPDESPGSPGSGPQTPGSGPGTPGSGYGSDTPMLRGGRFSSSGPGTPGSGADSPEIMRLQMRRC